MAAGHHGPDNFGMLRTLRGVVVEIGPGNGSSLDAYAPQAQVLAVEPDPPSARLASRRVGVACRHVRVLRGTAESLPLRAGSVDVVVSFMTLCSVGDPGRALGEIRRVLRPGGELRFVEHVAAPGRLLWSLQRLADTDRMRHRKGCWCSRETVAEIEHAGLEIRELWGGFFPARGLRAFRVYGVATRQ